MERARFRPGRDEKNARVGGTYSNRIRWQIPNYNADRLANAGFSVDQMRDSWPRGPSPLREMVMIDTAPHYPAAALAARHEGDVRMAASVDALGKVIGCSVIEGSMSADLDKAACAFMLSEGAFKPALDSGGKPTKGVVPATFRWLLPREKAAAAGVVPPRALGKFPISQPGASRGLRRCLCWSTPRAMRADAPIRMSAKPGLWRWGLTRVTQLAARKVISPSSMPREGRSRGT